MLKILRNDTISDILITDTGITIAASSTYEIQRMDYWLWSDSRDIVTQVVSGDVVVTDGEDDLPIRYAIALLQDNQVLLNEYYTLVQGDDVLVGNGEILYLNDDFPLTDNVPYPTNIILEEDDD